MWTSKKNTELFYVDRWKSVWAVVLTTRTHALILGWHWAELHNLYILTLPLVQRSGAHCSEATYTCSSSDLSIQGFSALCQMPPLGLNSGLITYWNRESGIKGIRRECGWHHNFLKLDSPHDYILVKQWSTHIRILVNHDSVSQAAQRLQAVHASTIKHVSKSQRTSRNTTRVKILTACTSGRKWQCITDAILTKGTILPSFIAL